MVPIFSAYSSQQKQNRQLGSKFYSDHLFPALSIDHNLGSVWCKVTLHSLCRPVWHRMFPMLCNSLLLEKKKFSFQFQQPYQIDKTQS